jgi:putative ABC transport system ATP-binding protein
MDVVTDERERTRVAARAEDAVKVYGKADAAVRALDGVTVEFPAGRFSAVMGPSGSGKSTLLHVMAGLDDLTSGRVFIGDVDLTTLSEKKLTLLRRDSVGFVFQAYNLVPVLTAAENAEYVMELKRVPTAERRRRIGALFDRMGITDLTDTRPLKMSGGQQQRVAVARAIASEPALVLADEPTANLDQVTGRALVALMRELNRERGVTFVFSTHDPMVLEHADRVVRIVDGAVASDERKAA